MNERNETFYRKFRAEMAAGGAATDVEQGTNGPWSLFGVALILAALGLLALVNIWTFLFVVGILISIFLHEMGHFVTARRTGMKVTQFFMGFGPRIWSTKRSDIEYGLRAIPLGAFVRIIGMNNLDEVDPQDEPRAYRSKPYPHRMLVITAGSMMHLVIAVTLLFTVYLVWGRQEETGVVRIVAPPAVGSPATVVGLQEGDVIVAFDGVAMTERDQLIDAIQSHEPGDVVVIDIERDGVPSTLEVGLGNNPNRPGVAYLGVSSDSIDFVPQSALDALGHGVGDLGEAAITSVRGVFTVLNPVNMWEHLSGEETDPQTRPATLVGASQVAGFAGDEEGLKAVLLLLAGVNVFVAVFNMFPLLPFDGGHAAIATYERIRSRRGRPYHADVSKMVPVATVVVGLLAMLLFTGLYLEITDPLGG
jgi:membrane-associated protease RseP (regulator of RpoE activity)